MNNKSSSLRISIFLLFLGTPVFAASSYGEAVIWTMLLVAFMTALIILWLAVQTKDILTEIMKPDNSDRAMEDYERFVSDLKSNEIQDLLDVQNKNGTLYSNKIAVTLLAIFLLPLSVHAQKPGATSLLKEQGIIITIALIATPILLGVFILTLKLNNALKVLKRQRREAQALRLSTILRDFSHSRSSQEFIEQKLALDYKLNNQELSGTGQAHDNRGLIKNVEIETGLPFVARKKKAAERPKIEPNLTRLITWYIGCATFWLVFGTTVGEYLGIKFIAPDTDQISWLSFGRLRPVHTNAVFWGWASLAMVGIGYYIVPRVSNASIFSIKLGWYTLVLINGAVLSGTLLLMAGVNNGGGEYREYIWPAMLPFAVGLILTLFNFFKTVGARTTTEIYISNWYIISSLIFGITIVIIAYLPFWQNGLGETIIQGYFMHQGVGMWFMLFTLGIVYYFLPQQLNRPIYSYSLGILAFWAQILFYTLIGTHHFVFSAIPWWLQTVAIVGSVGMVIPVVAGTTNFLMTFRGGWHKIADSYTLPFFLTGVVFYFSASLQGTAEAFRFTNLLWHFTDFTVAHSHLTMYGIICFFLWAAIYALMPRLTGLEPPQATVGAHFWLALLGLLFYTIPLMYGSTLRGMMWMDGKPFIESVILMAPFWIWRAIGGSLMWLSHIFFAYNLYRMVRTNSDLNIRHAAFQHLREN